VVGAPRAVTGEVNSGRGVGGERGRRLRAAPGLPVVVGKFAGRLARKVGKSRQIIRFGRGGAACGPSD